MPDKVHLTVWVETSIINTFKFNTSQLNVRLPVIERLLR
jgi:hypothetical protein